MKRIMGRSSFRLCRGTLALACGLHEKNFLPASKIKLISEMKCVLFLPGLHAEAPPHPCSSQTRNACEGRT